jgi:hypothetical protein
MENARSGSLSSTMAGHYFHQYGIVGQSRAIADVIGRIDLVSATRSTVLITGASGPQPHPSFIEVFCEAPVCDGHGTVAGAADDGAATLEGERAWLLSEALLNQAINFLSSRRRLSSRRCRR